MDENTAAAVKTLTKLVLSADYYASINKSLSRFYLLEAERMRAQLQMNPSSASQVCSYCCSIFRPGNCTRQILPRMKSTLKLRKLVQKQARQQQMTKFQKRIVSLFSSGENRMEICCHACQKKTLFPCAGRPPKVVALADVKTTPQEMSKNKKKKKNKKRSLHSSSIADDSLTDVTSTATPLHCSSSVNSSSSISRQTPLQPSSSLKLSRTQYSTPLLPVSSTKNKNKRQNMKQKHNLLRNILEQDKKSREKSTAVNLQHFLSSL